ncbi:MAG: type 1 periplasmic binding fold superfamily protein [Nonlabens sp.]
MKNSMKYLGLALAGTLAISCGDDDDVLPMIINEEEVITTVEIEMINVRDNNNVVMLRSNDPDGEGPLPPVQTQTGDLRVSENYDSTVKFYNELESPRENITKEIEMEDLDHEVFYFLGSTLSTAAIQRLDFDSQGNPLGLEFDLETTLSPATGTMTVVLRHEPTKPNDGTLADAGGDTDVEVIFDLTFN